jgi:hypothetical protein
MALAVRQVQQRQQLLHHNKGISCRHLQQQTGPRGGVATLKWTAAQGGRLAVSQGWVVRGQQQQGGLACPVIKATWLLARGSSINQGWLLRVP